MAQNPATRPFGPVCDCQIYFPINGCIHELDPNEAKPSEQYVMLDGPPNHDPIHANSPAPNSTTIDIIQAKHLQNMIHTQTIDRNKRKHYKQIAVDPYKIPHIQIACPNLFSSVQPFFIEDPRQRVTRTTYRWPCVDRFRGSPPAAGCTSGIAAQNLGNKCCPSSIGQRPTSIPSHPIRSFSRWKTRTKLTLHWSPTYKSMRISETQ